MRNFIFCALIIIVTVIGFTPSAQAAQVYADMVKESSTTTGTGTFSLGGAVTGYQTFVDGIGDGNTCTYQIKNATDWEVGLGTVTDDNPDTLSRDTVYASSNSGSKVNWPIGSKTVTCVLTAHNIDSFSSAGSPITLDIGDDGGNDSTAVNEIATNGDTNNAITMPSADKVYIDFSQNWPTADTAEVISDGTNTKTAAQVKSHIDSTSNPHSVTASQAGAVALTGDETVAGVKTFSSFPVTPSSSPSTDYQVANRKFVTDQIAITSGTINTIEEGDSQTGGSDIVTIDFNGDDFNLSESPDTEINITINDGGVDHDSTLNYSADEHFTQAAISITNSQISDTNAGTDPTADLEEETHASEHQSGGTDEIKLDDLGAPDDNTDLNVSITKHGLTPKAPNDASKFLDGTGSWSTPSGSGSAITLDLGDDGGDDSTDLTEIATSGDTNNIITMPSADKAHIDMGQNWPTSDTANSGDSATGFFSTGTIEHERGGLEANVSAYDGLVKISGGSTSQAVAGTDYLAPDGVGTALTALNGENIQDDTIDDDSIDFGDVTLNDLTFDVGGVSKTEFAYGSTVTSNIQDQIDAQEAELNNSAGLAAALSDETGTGSAVFSNSPTLVSPSLGTINSGVGTALTALNGENIQNDTIDDDAFDFGTGTDQVSAADIPIADAGNLITGTEVETALQENRSAIDSLEAVDNITETELSDESELEGQLTDVSDVYTDNDFAYGTAVTNGDANIPDADSVYDFATANFVEKTDYTFGTAVTNGEAGLTTGDDVYDFCETSQDYLKTSENDDFSFATANATKTFNASELTGRIELRHSGTTTYAFGTAQTVYELEQSAAVFVFATTDGAYFDAQATDKFIRNGATQADGYKVSALSPSVGDCFVLTPIKVGSDYQYMFSPVLGTYEDGGP